MDKVDLKRTLPDFAAKSGEFAILDLPPRQYLMIDGHGDPNTSEEFRSAVETLYPLAYALKFLSKRELDRDYVVPPLEGLWWAEDMSAFTSARDKSAWDFTLMLLVPDWLGREHFDTVVDDLDQKVAAGKKHLPRLGEVRFDTLAEGTCVQTLHLGPFDAEAAVLERLHHDVIPASGFEMSGKHHEIYLSDLRRVSADRLRTILRQPVRRTE